MVTGHEDKVKLGNLETRMARIEKDLEQINGYLRWIVILVGAAVIGAVLKNVGL